MTVTVSNGNFKKMNKTIVELQTENKGLKQLLKEVLIPLEAQIRILDKQLHKEKYTEQYSAQLCDLHCDIRGMLNEQQKP